MSEQAQAILDAAMKLPAGERSSRVNRLLRSLDDEPLTEREAEAMDALWAPELRRRIAEIDCGQVQCIPWDSVDAEMRKLIGEKELVLRRAPAPSCEPPCCGTASRTPRSLGVSSMP